jgi:hypothetical protein
MRAPFSSDCWLFTLLLFSFLAVLAFELSTYYTGSLSLEPLCQPCFVLGIFKIVCELFSWAWLQTLILLISTSRVARITGMSHWHLALLHFFILPVSSVSVRICPVLTACEFD